MVTIIYFELHIRNLRYHLPLVANLDGQIRLRFQVIKYFVSNRCRSRHPHRHPHRMWAARPFLWDVEILSSFLNDQNH